MTAAVLSGVRSIRVWVLLAGGVVGPVLGAPGGPAREASPSGVGVWEGLEFEDLDGESWEASRLVGKIVLLDFWASWCTPCRAQIPNLRRIREEIGSDRLVILGVNLEKARRAKLRSFLHRYGVDWPQVHDGLGIAGQLPRRFGVETVPRTIVVDGRGRLIAVDLSDEALGVVLHDLVRQADREEGEADGTRVEADPAGAQSSGLEEL